MSRETVNRTREILFRGKRADNGEWVYGYFCECPCDDGTDIPSIMRIESKENHRTLMQYPVISETVGRFTGLTDKNGTKIFEGDILEASNGNRGYVVFENGAFMKLHNPKGMPFLIAADVNEVIGNIHDNPEMLKGE